MKKGKRSTNTSSRNRHECTIAETLRSGGAHVLFAKAVRAFVKRLPRTICNIEDVKQLVRSSGSVGANYIEANESLGKKDFRMHVKIAREEDERIALLAASLTATTVPI